MRSFTHIATFLEVVHRNSFATAARHLKITPAAVSKQIRSLEMELGVCLLKRSTRKLELTPVGQIYFEHAQGIWESCKLAEAAISESRVAAGDLKVVCGPHFGNQYVIPYLKEYLERYPKITLHIDFTQSIPDLEKEKVDLIVGLSSGIPQNCVVRRLILAENVLCASPCYLKRHGTPKKPSDLSMHNIIVHSMNRPKDSIAFKNDITVFVKPIIYFNDTRAMRASAVDGMGIVQLHDYIIADDLREKRLVQVLQRYSEKKTIPLYIAYPQTSLVHHKVRTFIDFVVSKTR